MTDLRSGAFCRVVAKPLAVPNPQRWRGANPAVYVCTLLRTKHNCMNASELKGIKARVEALRGYL